MWVNYLLQRENNSFNPREPQKILTLVSLPFTFFLSSVKLSTTSMTSAKGTTHKPDCGVKVNPSQCNGSQQFSNMVVLCFLGIFSKSFCGNQSQMFRNSFRCCFVCVCLGVHCTHSWNKTKVHLFLDKAIFQQDNHLSSSVPQLHSHVNILKWRCVVSHLLVLSESVAKQLA